MLDNAESMEVAFLRLEGTNERIDRQNLARYRSAPVDIKGALADHTQRYVFGVPKSSIASLAGRFPKFTPEHLYKTR